MKYDGIPPYPETQHYVRNIMSMLGHAHEHRTAVEPPTPHALPDRRARQPAGPDVGAAAAFALAIQLALGVGPGGSRRRRSPSRAKPTDGNDRPTRRPTPDRRRGHRRPPTDRCAEQRSPRSSLPTPLRCRSPRRATKAAATDATAAVEAAAPCRASRRHRAPAEPDDRASTPTHHRTPTRRPAATGPVAVRSPPTPTAAPAPATPDQPPAAPTRPPPRRAPVATGRRPATPPATPARAPSSPPGHPRGDQLVSHGDGVHRVTLELNPKALGEVRVVLTVRHGDVHVRLAAGSEARAALAQSAGDLTRALEHIGVKDHRLTLAELPGVDREREHPDPLRHHGASSGQNASLHRTLRHRAHTTITQPRTGDGTTATDGTDHDHGSRTRGDRSIHGSATSPAAGGVDVRM